jgi:hypothetical protein
VHKKLFLFIVGLFIINGLYAREVAILRGYVYASDKDSTPLDMVQILINQKFMGDLTGENGFYQLKLLPNTEYEIEFRYLGQSRSFTINPLANNEIRVLNVVLNVKPKELGTVEIKGQKDREPVTTFKIKPREFAAIPTVGSGIEALIKTLPGVASGNELSSQYNVRGGSFDENLVYVNDFEVFRPQLIRTGQQEGLSFINENMVDNISFSAGGFESRYGDKMSSVLDVQYRKPKKFEATVTGSFMGGGFHMEGVSKKRRLSYLVGARYQANNYVLGTLDVKGQYNPVYLDVQSLFNYHLNSNWRIEWLTNISRNKFSLVPESQETSFGTVQAALRLYVGMAGNEVMEYSTAMSGLALVYEPYNGEVSMKWMVSGVSSLEQEFYDIRGAYNLDLVDNNQGSDNFGNTVATLGTGYFINHARNELYYRILTTDYKGEYKPHDKNFVLKWGLGYRQDFIEDRFKEWKYQDSAGYNISPSSPSLDSIVLNEYVNSTISFVNHRVLGYAQGQWTLNEANNTQLIAGVRSHYTGLNGQTVLSPRVQFSTEPNRAYNEKVNFDDSLMKKDYVLRAAAGFYHQPPFYREMRDFDGSLNEALKAQQSIHFTAGGDYYFKMWDRPFKLYGEAYYKQMDYLVPYVLDNMRIRYYADNTARGYATGVDARINGNFVPGYESWFSLSVLKTNEIIEYVDNNGELIESPYLRRPTDRRVSASLLFQDVLPKNEDYQFNLNLVFGSGLPYFLPGPSRYSERPFRIPPYRRVDVGFTRILIKEPKIKGPDYKPKMISSMWISAEVFNLLQINNVISYMWIRDFQGSIFGVPNFLTGRRINLRIMARLG